MRRFETRLGFLGGVFRYFGARRALVPFVATVAYVAGIGVRVDRGLGGRPWLVGALAVAGAFVAARPSLPGNGLREDGRRDVGSFAYALFGLAVVVASLDAKTPELLQDLSGLLAASFASVTAAQALARVRGGEGVADSLAPPPRSLRVVTFGLLVLAGGLGAFASFQALRDPGATATDSFPRDVHAVAEGGALLILGGSTWEQLRLRRLALEAGDRTLTALGAIVATGLVATGFLLVDAGATYRILRLAVALAAAIVTYVALHGDAPALARRGRRAVALVLFGGPVVLLGALAAGGPGRSLVALLVTGLAALFVGSAVAYLEQPLRRAEGRLLDAAENARLALVRADPDTSMRDALTAVRGFAGPTGQSPELWSLAPPLVLTIDGAGYPRERGAVLPPHLLAIAVGEPEATVRTELLEALVVRRPDLRPLARWLDERGALAATLVTREGDVEGVLVVPRGGRRDPMSLEEARALKRLADAFAGASAARAALLRSLERERLSTARAEEAEERLLAREHHDQTAAARHRVVAARLAEDALGPYAPGARVAFEAALRRVRAAAPIVLVAPHGSFVVGYLARAHLEGPRGRAPFVVVDCASPRPHDLAAWSHPTESPLALAEGGLLVLDAGARLPKTVQALVGDALAERRAPWEGGRPLTVTLALTSSVSAAELREALDPALAARLDDALEAPIEWPRLRDRGEDLRSLVLAGLVREGLRVRGEPLGIDDAAFGQLAEYGYPGDDAELQGILLRLALAATGPVVRAVDVRALQLHE